MSTVKPFDTSGVAEKLAWERPERKDQAGSLTIFGGVSLKLKEVDTIFKSSKECGIGSVYALVPESLARVFKREEQCLIPINFDNYYGLSDLGYKTLLEELALADGLVLADIGASSATHHKLALAISKTFKPVIMTNSSLGLLQNYSNELKDNPNITFICSIQSLQKFIKSSGLKITKPLLSDSSFNMKLEVLHQLSTQIKLKVLLVDNKKLLLLNQDKYISIDLKDSDLELAARLICWQIWAPRSNMLEQSLAATSNI